MYAKNEIAAWQALQGAYEKHREIYEAAETPPAVEPVAPAEPVPFTVRELEEAEVLETLHGPALVAPPLVVLTRGAETFAVPPETLEQDYVSELP